MVLPPSELALRMDYDDAMTKSLLKNLRVGESVRLPSSPTYYHSPTPAVGVVTLPQPITNADIDSYDRITSAPWLLMSIQPTGSRWGRRIADVKILGIPKNLLGIALLDDKDNLRLVFARWDRHAHQGWDKDFTVTLVYYPSDGNYSRKIIVPSSSRLEDNHSFIVDNQHPPPRERIPQLTRVIPRVLWNISTPAIPERSSHAVRCLLRNIRFMTDFVQCTSLYMVLEGEACMREVENSGIPNFLEAYNSLVPGSYKADLMRYYVLYRYGGVYVDDKCTIRYSLDSEVFDSILRDGCDMFIGIIGWGGGVPEIAFMGARAGCTVMLKALEASIDNIINRRYGEDRLAITGSTMLRKVMLEEGNPSSLTDDVRRQRFTTMMSTPEAVEDGIGINWIDNCLGNKVALLRVERCYEKIYHGKELVWHRQAIPFNDWPKVNYYWDLWKSRQVYVDGNPPTPFSSRFSSFMDRSGMNNVLIVVVALLALSAIGAVLYAFPAITL